MGKFNACPPVDCKLGPMQRGNVDNHIVKAWKQLYEKIYTSAALCGQAVLMNARPQLEGVEGWNTLPGYDYKKYRFVGNLEGVAES